MARIGSVQALKAGGTCVHTGQLAHVPPRCLSPLHSDGDAYAARSKAVENTIVVVAVGYSDTAVDLLLVTVYLLVCSQQ